MREELLKTVADATDKGMRAAAKGALPAPDSFESPDLEQGRGSDEYGAFEQQRQLEIMQEQDQALDGVFQTVGNLRQQADDMGRELGEQHELLEDVDGLADRVGGKLQGGLKRMGYVIKKNEGKSRCTIYYALKEANGW